MQVEVRPGQFERALKKFKKKVEKDGVLDEVKNRQYFMTKSQKRRLKHKKAVRRLQKEKEKYGE